MKTPPAAVFSMRYPLAVLLAASAMALPSSAGERSAAGVTATGLKSFEGIEEPKVRYIVAEDRFAPDDFVNITDIGDNTVRMMLRYRPNAWWEGDRTTKSKDRQRAEVKGLGPHQKEGETFEYATTWRTNPTFQGANRFCHIFQLKATDGDNGAPLVVLSIHQGTNSASVRYWPGDARNFLVARRFAWKPGVRQTVRIRIKTSTEKKGEVTASVDGDPFQGVTGVAVYRPRATDYRPKWGLYRGVGRNMPLGDDYVDHKNASARKLSGKETQ